MMELDELKVALNWDGVYQGKHCLMVSFEERDAGLIQGLKVSSDCYYLDYPEFDNTMIGFHVIDLDLTSHYYYVLNGRLHNPHGPARISVSNHKIISQWMVSGMLHRTDGPAIVTLDGWTGYDEGHHPITGHLLGDYHTVLEFDSMECYWHQQGIPAVYPQPHSALFHNGFETHYADSSGKPVLDNFNDQPAFYAESATFNWGGGDNFRPRLLHVASYLKNYDRGEYKSHSCNSINSSAWIDNGETVHSSNTAKEILRTDCFPYWNMWEGPFFPSRQDELFAFQSAFKEADDD